MNRFFLLYSSVILWGIFSVGNASAAESYQLLDVPKVRALGGPCTTYDGYGAAQLVFYVSQGGTCTTDEWYYSKYHVLTTKNPGDITVYWNARQPSGTQICGRVVTYKRNNVQWSEKSDWVCGGGNKNATPPSVPSALGRVELEIRMQSSSQDKTPQLRTFGSKIYTP